MSWDVTLHNQDGTVAQVTRHQDGGTYVLGGTTDAELNITYNYSAHYYAHLDHEAGLRWLDGKRAGDCTERLAAAIGTLGTVHSSDYWASTPGNAGYALSILFCWAMVHPDGIFEVT